MWGWGRRGILRAQCLPTPRQDLGPILTLEIKCLSQVHRSVAHTISSTRAH